ncbi:MAG: TonB-dependent receptor [Pseudomonas sp.]
MKGLLGTMMLLMCVGWAQAQLKIQGRVWDKAQQAVAFANVALYAESVFVSGSLTDSLGNFVFEKIPKGSYQIIAGYVGSRDTTAIQLNTDTTINISIAIAELQGVEVVARKALIERKVDRLVFNVENSVAASGGNALDALRITPGVQVKSDQIAIVGKSSLAVMIDDRMVQLSGESLMDYLRSIAADDIKSIEVITTPPAKYDAEGNSGLLNIKLEKGRKNAWNSSIRTSYVQTTYPAFALGNTFTYNKNKLSLLISADAKTGHEAALYKISVDYPNQIWNSNSKQKDKKDFYTGKLNADYELSEKSSIGLIAQYYQSTPDSRSGTMQNIYDENKVLFNVLNTQSFTDETNKNAAFNLHYNQQLDSNGKTMSVDVDYFNYQETKNNAFDSKLNDLDNNVLHRLIADNNGNLAINNYAVKIDVEHPVKFGKFTYGAKTSFVQTNSGILFADKTSGTAIIDTAQSDNFEYRENMQALYADFAKKIGSKWQAKIGLRYECTQTQGVAKNNATPVKNNYGKLFPTAYLLYSINENNFINLNYSRRISRPYFWELNPFRWYINPNSYVEGNPFLQPSFNNNVELTYGYKQKWFTTAFAQITNNGYAQVPLVDSVNFQQIFTRLNFFKSYVYGLVQNYVFNRWHWWQSTAQASAFYSRTTANDLYKNAVPTQNGIGFNLNLNNNFVLNKGGTILGEANLSYASPRNAMIYQIRSVTSVDAGMKFLLLNKKLICALNVYDIFKTSAQQVTTFTSGVQQNLYTYKNNRFFRVSLQYNFGNNKIQAQERNFGNEDERNRVKQ